MTVFKWDVFVCTRRSNLNKIYSSATIGIVIYLYVFFLYFVADHLFTLVDILGSFHEYFIYARVVSFLVSENRTVPEGNPRPSTG